MLEEDADMIEEHGERFITKASILVTEWQKQEMLKIKNDQMQPTKKDKRK